MATTTATSLRAFHGDLAIKARYLARLQEHQKLGQIRQAQSTVRDLEARAFSGSAVECTIHSLDHSAYESELGIPIMFSWLEDEIFEDIVGADAPQFAVDFLDAIPVGADLSLVAPQFLLWLLMDDVDGVTRFAKTADVMVAIRDVGDQLSRFLSGETVTTEQWRAVADAAVDAYTTAHAAAAARVKNSTSAEVDAAHAAASIASPGRLASAAVAAADAASYAAYTANAPKTDAVAAGNAYRASRTKQAAKLLQLLCEAPVTT